MQKNGHIMPGCSITERGICDEAVTADMNSALAQSSSNILIHTYTQCRMPDFAHKVLNIPTNTRSSLGDNR